MKIHHTGHGINQVFETLCFIQHETILQFVYGKCTTRELDRGNYLHNISILYRDEDKDITVCSPVAEQLTPDGSTHSVSAIPDDVGILVTVLVVELSEIIT